jgi:hypothetical protein
MDRYILCSGCCDAIRCYLRGSHSPPPA